MFQENLKRLVASTEGAVAGLLMGFDGIAVDSFSSPQAGVDIQTVGMEFSFILTQVRKAAEILEVGGVQEIAIRAEKLTVLIRVISSVVYPANSQYRSLMRTKRPVAVSISATPTAACSNIVRKRLSASLCPSWKRVRSATAAAKVAAVTETAHTKTWSISSD